MLFALALVSSSFAQDTTPSTSTTTVDPVEVKTQDDVPRTFGLGLGNGTAIYGISGKYTLSERDAVQGVVGRWYGQGFGAGVGADYIRDMGVVTENPDVGLSWHVGGGGVIGSGASTLDNKLLFGGSGIVGLTIEPKRAPIDIALEYRPGVTLAPKPHLNIVQFGGHIRYWF